MSKSAGKSAVHLNSPNPKRRGDFKALLESIEMAWFEKRRVDPIDEVAKSLAQKEGKTVAYVQKRLKPMLAHLYESCVIQTAIRQDRIAELAPRFYRETWNARTILPDVQANLRTYLRVERGIDLVFAEKHQSVYDILAKDLLESLNRQSSPKVLVSHGKTFSDFAEAFTRLVQSRIDPDSNRKSESGGELSNAIENLYVEGGEPIFLPSSGNFETSDSKLTSSQFKYLYDFSANEIAMSLNSLFGRRTLRLSTPAIISVLAGKKGIEQESREETIVQKGLFKKNRSYVQVYTETGSLQADIRTALFTLGVPKGDGKESVIKLLQDTDPYLRIHKNRLKNMHEILFRLYEGGCLVGNGEKTFFGKGDPETLEYYLNILYYCFLGLKESSCLELADRHRKAFTNPKGALGLGSVAIFVDPEKADNLLMAMLKQPEPALKRKADPSDEKAGHSKSFINRVYMPIRLMPDLVAALDKVPESIRPPAFQAVGAGKGA